MRIAGYLDRGGITATVFTNDNKMFVKLECDMLEQTYKFREDIHLDSVQELDKLFDTDFMKFTITTFEQMSKNRAEAYQRWQNAQKEIIDQDII